MAINAQLMIFSGRPDPEFPVPDDAVDELVTRVSQVVEGTQTEQPQEGGLGYHGLRVSNTEGRTGLPEELEAFRGVVTEMNGGMTRHFVDSAGVEDFLLDQARAAGLGELLDAAGLDQGIA